MYGGIRKDVGVGDRGNGGIYQYQDRPLSVSKLSTDRTQPFEKKPTISNIKPVSNANTHHNVGYRGTAVPMIPVMLSQSNEIDKKLVKGDNNNTIDSPRRLVPDIVINISSIPNSTDPSAAATTTSSSCLDNGLVHANNSQEPTRENSDDTAATTDLHGNGSGTGSSQPTSPKLPTSAAVKLPVVTIQPLSTQPFAPPAMCGTSPVDSPRCHVSGSSSVSSIPALLPSLQPALIGDFAATRTTSNDRIIDIKGPHSTSKDSTNTNGGCMLVIPGGYDSDSSSKRLYGTDKDNNTAPSSTKPFSIHRVGSDEHSYATISEVSDGEKSYAGSIQKPQIPMRRPSHLATSSKDTVGSNGHRELRLFQRRPSSSTMSMDSVINRSSSIPYGVGGGNRRSKTRGIAAATAAPAAITSGASVISAVSMRSATSTAHSQISHASQNTGWSNASNKKLLTLREFRLDVSAVVDGQEHQRKLLYIPNYLSQSVLGCNHSKYHHQGSASPSSTGGVNDQRIENILQTVELDEIEVVFYLLPSVLRQQVSYRPNFDSPNTTTYNQIKTQLFVFLRSILIPFMKQLHKRVLILINNCEDCLLTSLFAEIALAEQAKVQQGFVNDLPWFQVLQCINHHKSVPHSKDISLFDPNRTEDLNQFREKMIHSMRQSRCVNRATVAQAVPHTHSNVDEEESLNPVANVVLVIEVVETTTTSHSPFNNKHTILEGESLNAETVLLAMLRWFVGIAKIPVIALQGLEIERSFHLLTHLASMQIPIVLLDSVNNAFTNSREVQLYDVQVPVPSQQAQTMPSLASSSEGLSSGVKSLDAMEKGYSNADRLPTNSNQDLDQRIISDAIHIVDTKCFLTYGTAFMNTSSLVAIIHSALFFASVISATTATPTTTTPPRPSASREGSFLSSSYRDSKRVSPSNPHHPRYSYRSRNKEDRSSRTPSMSLTPTTAGAAASTGADEDIVERSIASPLVDQILTFFNSCMALNQQESPAAFFNLVFNRNMIHPCSLYDHQSVVWNLLNKLITSQMDHHYRHRWSTMNHRTSSLSSFLSFQHQRQVKKHHLYMKRLLTETLQCAFVYEEQAKIFKRLTQISALLLAVITICIVLLSILQTVVSSTTVMRLTLIILSLVLMVLLLVVFVVLKPYSQWQCYHTASAKLYTECWLLRVGHGYPSLSHSQSHTHSYVLAHSHSNRSNESTGHSHIEPQSQPPAMSYGRTISGESKYNNHETDPTSSPACTTSSTAATVAAISSGCGSSSESDNREKRFLHSVHEIKSLIAVTNQEALTISSLSESWIKARSKGDSMLHWLYSYGYKVSAWFVKAEAGDVTPVSSSTPTPMKTRTTAMTVNIFQKIRNEEIQSFSDLIEDLHITLQESIDSHDVDDDQYTGKSHSKVLVGNTAASSFSPSLTRYRCLVNQLSQPLSSDEYIRYRVNPTLQYYRQCLSQFKCFVLLCQCIILVSCLLCIALSFFFHFEWISFVVIIAVVCMFSCYVLQGTSMRYTWAINAVEEIVQRNPSSEDSHQYLQWYEKVFIPCEEIFHSIQFAWISTSMTALKMIKKY